MSVSNEAEVEPEPQLVAPLNQSSSIPPAPPPPPSRARTRDDDANDVMSEVMSEDAIQGRVLDKLRTGFSAIEEMGCALSELGLLSILSNEMKQ
eukprot:1184852-Prorocentrum_minimum.AAC.4